MLNHDNGMTATDQPLKQLQQHRDIVEMQSSRRLIENEEIAKCGLVRAGLELIADCGFAIRRPLDVRCSMFDVFCIGQMTNEF